MYRVVEFTQKETLYKGYFHKWIKNNQSVFAMIEDLDGYVHYVHYKHIKFLSEPNIQKKDKKLITDKEREMDYPPF